MKGEFKKIQVNLINFDLRMFVNLYLLRSTKSSSGNINAKISFLYGESVCLLISRHSWEIQQMPYKNYRVPKYADYKTAA